MYKYVDYLKSVVKSIVRKLGISSLFRRVPGIPRGEVEAFFEKLDRQGIEYVILRWFERLPVIQVGEDLDILVADHDVRRLRKLLKRGKHGDDNFVKCDVFTKTSQRGYMAYYPPRIAGLILENRVRHKSGAWAPCSKHYFLSLIYHVLFHKGFKSGLQSEYVSTFHGEPEHDYVRALIDLAHENHIEDLNVTMEGLEKILEQNDWLPPLDIYFRRSGRNEWVYCRAISRIQSEWKWRKGTAVFVIREQGYRPEIISKLQSLLAKLNVELVDSLELNEAQAIYFAQHTRGGDWGKGPSPISGGLPKLVVIAVCNEQRRTQTHEEDIPQGVVEYAWVKKVKNTIRDEYLHKVGRRFRCNVIHSSDNGIEASYYLDVLEKMKAIETSKG